MFITSFFLNISIVKLVSPHIIITYNQAVANKKWMLKVISAKIIHNEDQSGILYRLIFFIKGRSFWWHSFVFANDTGKEDAKGYQGSWPKCIYFVFNTKLTNFITLIVLGEMAALKKRSAFTWNLSYRLVWL